MEYIPVVLAIGILATLIFWIRRVLDENYQAQKSLDQYLKGDFSPLEIGTFYERYIGHLYELEGYHVNYHGALNGFSDMGRDLIITSYEAKETVIVQTKCWAGYKQIHENSIFQLYGSMEHFKRTSKRRGHEVFARFYTTAQYTKKAKEVAEVLGIELSTEPLKKTYALVKCNVNSKGEKIYHLPFDPYYDKVKIHPENGEHFVRTVKEAVAKGFRRARNKQRQKKKAA